MIAQGRSDPLGAEQPIILQWRPVKALGPDEYYRVSVDFNHGETNSLAVFRTRETQFTLPESLYRTPNCGVFNWQVTIMRGAGGASDGGQPPGRAPRSKSQAGERQ